MHTSAIKRMETINKIAKLPEQKMILFQKEYYCINKNSIGITAIC
ncbi:MAG: hypothetical protein PF551_04980 [Candidatus Marinimicrobia bacterium]|jgi:hypothetical protein|nr:hypothetical protein [Candidatus Neomarinimicrobiota bacterium]